MFTEHVISLPLMIFSVCAVSIACSPVTLIDLVVHHLHYIFIIISSLHLYEEGEYRKWDRHHYTGVSISINNSKGI